jgi:hypothetical protein
MTEIRMLKTVRALRRFGYLDFGIRICFEFRASGFGFLLTE